MIHINKNNYLEELENYKRVKKAQSIKEKNEMKQRRVIFHYTNRSLKNNTSFKNSKQVVAKLLSNIGGKSIERCFDYLCKESEDKYFISDTGSITATKDYVIENWKKDLGLDTNSIDKKDCWHLMFSINEKYTNENKKKLENAVKSVMKENFIGYSYVMKIHTHQNNLHAHIILNKRNKITGKKITFKNKEDLKDFWFDIRENFSANLLLNGLNYYNKYSLEKDLSKSLENAKNNLSFCNYNDDNFNKNILDKMNSQIYINSNIINNTSKRVEKLELLKKSLEYDVNNIKNIINDYKNKVSYTKEYNIKELQSDFKKLNNKYFKVLKDLNKEYSKLRIANNLYEKNNYFYKLQYENEIKNLNKYKIFLNQFNAMKKNKDYNMSKNVYENYIEVKKAYDISNDNIDKLKILITKNNVLSQALFNNKDQTIFSLNKKYKNLVTNIEVLKIDNDSNLNNYKSLLENNKEVLKDMMFQRYEIINTKMEKLKKENKIIDKESFLYKEYEKSLEIFKQFYDPKGKKQDKKQSISNKKGLEL